ncbi:uncharacterized protein [Drosophila pseudoobscura]|uniref:Uncharacterized protein n=1 Tax=Drosophila pseudoobscura pseudoobscura TaxID=46245 RepID=A0A6I8UN75_DROPS|nr:uncharacterized protein LOC4800925 [Drosophila pseudoobscura]
MIRTTACLYVSLLLICLSIERNDGATKVLYEFHIRESTGNREEKGELKGNSTSGENESRAEPELIITGKRTSSVILPGCDPTTGDYVYKEDATYKADNSGYHVKYNFSIEPLELGTRLNAKTLKVSVG